MTECRPPDAKLVRAIQSNAPRVIAFGSGKGGVGKSLLCAGVGVFMAHIGKRVVLVDAAFGCASLHRLIGLPEGGPSLVDFFSRKLATLQDAVLSTPFRQLGLIRGGGALAGEDPKPAQRRRLVSLLRTLDADFVLLDLGAGCDQRVVHPFLSADTRVVVTTPEATATENAFHLIRNAFWHRVQQEDHAQEIDSLNSALRLASARREKLPAAVQSLIRSASTHSSVELVLNQTKLRDDLELGADLEQLARFQLGLQVRYLGFVEYDQTASAAIRRGTALHLEYPTAKITRDIDRVARRILCLHAEANTEHESPGTNHYQVLGLAPGVSPTEIRRAYRRRRRLCDDPQPALAHLLPEDGRRRLAAQIDDAYETLVDSDKRRDYDGRLAPAGTPRTRAASSRRVQRTEQPAGVAAKEAVVAPQPSEQPLEFSGEVLREIRRNRGVQLEDLADRTKITVTYLRAIEEENFRCTPAPVYLRGFVKSIARCLQLDPDKAARDYMLRFERGLDAGVRG